MGRIVKYEKVEPHHCSACDRMIGQTSPTRAWIRRQFEGCATCDHEIVQLLTACYRRELDVIYLEGNQ